MVYFIVFSLSLCFSITYLVLFRAFLIVQLVKNLPAMQETWVQFLGWEDPLEKEMATHSQYSCLENLMDRGAWRATVHGVTKSRKGLSDFHFFWASLVAQFVKNLPAIQETGV